MRNLLKDLLDVFFFMFIVIALFLILSELKRIQDEKPCEWFINSIDGSVSRDVPARCIITEGETK